MSNCQESTSRYLYHWFKELTVLAEKYVEPCLDTYTTEFVKYTCDYMKQDTHVFGMSMELLDGYMQLKNTLGVNIEDPVLTVTCVVFICSKLVGEQADLRIHHVQTYLEKMTKRTYHNNSIGRSEVDIFRTFGGKLPLHSKIDDLNIFLEVYLLQTKSRPVIRSLCIKILEILYIQKKNIVEEIKSIYVRTKEARAAFEELMTHRLYFVSGILLCALYVGKINNFNIEHVLTDLHNITSLHSDHMLILSNILYKYVNNYITDK